MIQNITNKASLMWEIGTDCLNELDLEKLNNPDLVTMTDVDGPMAIISIEYWKYIKHHYSDFMNELFKQAESKGYQYIMFDADLITEAEDL